MDTNKIDSLPLYAVIVDDDPVQLTTLSLIARKAGLESRLFANAEDALADMAPPSGTIDDRPCGLPAIIITDLHLPGIDGWRFARLLRSPEHLTLNHIPIIVVSAISIGVMPEVIAADLGVEAFLPVPIDAARFIDTVKSLIGKGMAHSLPRVLIVEDSRSLAHMLRKTFSRHGYELAIALNCREAIAACASNSYDLAVMDYHLPDGTGEDILDRLRKEQPSCACIMMTTDPSPHLALNWMKRGAAAYLRKPFDPEYLMTLALKVRRERSLLHTWDLLEERTRELRESEARFRNLFHESSSIAIQGYAPDGTTLFWNRESERLYGYSAGEAVGRNLLELIIPPEMREDVRQGIENICLTSAPIPSAELLLMAKDGSRVSVFSTHTLVQIPGKPTELYCMDIDLAERRRLEEELRKSAEKLRLALEVAHMGYWIFHCATGQVEWSQEHQTLFGISPGKFTGTLEAVAERIHPDDHGRGWEMLARTLSETIPFDITYRAVHPSGDIRWLHTFGLPFPDAEGKTDHIFGVSQDITKMKQEEEEKALLQRSLQQSRKMESIGTLAGGIAHDFNNMLGVILGRTELALRQAPPETKLHSNLLEIRKAAERSADLTRQLLSFSRDNKTSPRVLDVNQAVGKMLSIIRRVIGEQIHLSWSPGPNPWPVWVDPSQFDQILLNLSVNARDAISGAGCLTVETSNVFTTEDMCVMHPEIVPGEYLLLEVGDNGCGMNPETLERIFEPFFTTKDIGKGTGIGLATVYGIVQQSKGCIDVKSTPGQGTVFSIYLPRCEAYHDGESDVGENELALSGNNEIILVVEDEPANLELAAVMLKGMGYSPLTAASPREAFGIAETHEGAIDLLLTDVILPEMNGRDLADKLTALRPGMKRLYMSGHDNDAISRSGILDQEIDLIKKPFTMDELGRRLKKVLEGDKSRGTA